MRRGIFQTFKGNRTQDWRSLLVMDVRPLRHLSDTARTTSSSWFTVSTLARATFLAMIFSNNWGNLVYLYFGCARNFSKFLVSWISYVNPFQLFGSVSNWNNWRVLWYTVCVFLRGSVNYFVDFETLIRRVGLNKRMENYRLMAKL
jgi:hypothetical protein